MYLRSLISLNEINVTPTELLNEKVRYVANKMAIAYERNMRKIWMEEIEEAFGRKVWEHDPVRPIHHIMSDMMKYRPHRFKKMCLAVSFICFVW